MVTKSLFIHKHAESESVHLTCSIVFYGDKVRSRALASICLRVCVCAGKVRRVNDRS